MGWMAVFLVAVPGVGVMAVEVSTRDKVTRNSTANCIDIITNTHLYIHIMINFKSVF